MLVAGLLAVAMLVPVQGVLAEVYEAPYYQAPQAEVALASYGPMGPMPGQMMAPGYGQMGPGCGYSGNPAECGSPATKLGRGVANTLTGWMELPKHTLMGVFSCNVTPIEGAAVGVFRGFGRAVERTGIGLYEVFTFPIPGYAPLLCPEYISLEGNCGCWRNEPYCSGNCCPPPCVPPCPNPCEGGWNQVFQKSAPDSMAMGNQPQTPPAAPSRERAPGSVTYPDDFLK